MVEIARAFVASVKVLILDEPTAVIFGREVDLLFDRLVALRASGVAIVYISHRLEEIFRIADRVRALPKDGLKVATRSVGRGQSRPVDFADGRPRLVATSPRPARRFRARRACSCDAEGISVGRRVRNASLMLRSGEIVGLAGLVGSGRTELAQAIFGGVPIDAGKIQIAGALVYKNFAA